MWVTDHHVPIDYRIVWGMVELEIKLGLSDSPSTCSMSTALYPFRDEALPHRRVPCGRKHGVKEVADAIVPMLFEAADRTSETVEAFGVNLLLTPVS